MGCTTAPVAGSGPCPTCTARVEKPQLLSATMRYELEQVGARDHRHWLAGLDYEDGLLPAQQRLEGVVDRRVDTDLAQRGVHRLGHRRRHHRRIAVHAVKQRALLQRADDALSVVGHWNLRDSVALHDVDG